MFLMVGRDDFFQQVSLSFPLHKRKILFLQEKKGNPAVVSTFFLPCLLILKHNVQELHLIVPQSTVVLAHYSLIFQSTTNSIIEWIILHMSCSNFWNIMLSVTCGVTDWYSLPAFLFFVRSISQLLFPPRIMSGVSLIFLAWEEPGKFAGPS